jgi:hypothetical protein
VCVSPSTCSTGQWSALRNWPSPIAVAFRDAVCDAHSYYVPLDTHLPLQLMRRWHGLEDGSENRSVEWRWAVGVDSGAWERE